MLNPHYIVGFVDGEGCFSISINKNNNRLPEVRLIFEIELREVGESIFSNGIRFRLRNAYGLSSFAK